MLILIYFKCHNTLLRDSPARACKSYGLTIYDLQEQLNISYKTPANGTCQGRMT